MLVVVILFWWLGANTLDTMARAGITPGFDFLRRSANFEIGESLISYSSADTYGRAILVGLLNTIRVAMLGCVLATVLGVVLAVMRLSGNPLLKWLIQGYIEVVRNTPLLLQLFFWSALTKALPAPRQAISLGEFGFLSNRGVYIPGAFVESVPAAALVIGALALLLGLGLLALVRRSEHRRRWVALAVALAIVLAAGITMVMLGLSIRVETPKLTGFNIRGGYSLSPEFTVLLVGLTIKFSGSIAEIVRAGIVAVDRGQWEAARSLGLHNGQIMRHIVLPQALRVITPLVTSSYLDLTKDSSLAVAIGYPDLVNVINTTSNTTGQALEALAILVGIYLVLNLSVSALMNVYNRRVALRGVRAR